MKINYKEILKEVAASSEKNSKDVQLIVSSFVDVIKNNLAKGNDVNILGFCKFKVVEKKARKEYNFQKKELCDAPAKKLPKCEFVKKVKETINQ